MSVRKWKWLCDLDNNTQIRFLQCSYCGKILGIKAISGSTETPLLLRNCKHYVWHVRSGSPEIPIWAINWVQGYGKTFFLARTKVSRLE